MGSTLTERQKERCLLNTLSFLVAVPAERRVEGDLVELKSSQPDPNSNTQPEYSKERKAMAWAVVVLIAILVVMLVFMPQLKAALTTAFGATAAMVIIMLLIVAIIAAIIVCMVLEPDWLDIISGQVGSAVTTITDSVSGVLEQLPQAAGAGLGGFFSGAWKFLLAAGVGVGSYFLIKSAIGKDGSDASSGSNLNIKVNGGDR